MANLRTIISIAAIAALPATSTVAVAQFIPGYPDDYRGAYDPREVALLPDYCKYTQLYRQNIPGGNDQAAIKRMYDTYGPGFHALHHYCWALISTHRALFLAPTRQTRTFYLQDAIKDIQFVIANSPKDFVLLPELLTAKARNHIRLDQGSAAVADLLSAINMKPDYWPPYAALSDYYKQQGNADKAREVLEEGLEAAPDANALKRRLAALGGSGRKTTNSTSQRP